MKSLLAEYTLSHMGAGKLFLLDIFFLLNKAPWLLILVIVFSDYTHGIGLFPLDLKMHRRPFTTVFLMSRHDITMCRKFELQDAPMSGKFVKIILTYDWIIIKSSWQKEITRNLIMSPFFPPISSIRSLLTVYHNILWAHSNKIISEVQILFFLYIDTYASHIFEWRTKNKLAVDSFFFIYPVQYEVQKNALIRKYTPKTFTPSFSKELL